MPIALACVIVTGAHLALASTDPTTEQLAEYLQTNQLFVSSEAINGFQQIFYSFGDSKVFLTEGNTNHSRPISSREYVTWLETIEGTNQLFLYNVITKSKLQLTGYSVNQNQVMDGNRVAWETWVNDRWQIMYYDGFTVRQLSSGDTAVRAAINGNKIVYAQQKTISVWDILLYDVSTNQTEIIKTTDEQNAWPRFDGDEIKTLYPVLDN